MSWSEIERVERLPASPLLLGHTVDIPAPGDRCEGYFIRIAGWVAPSDSAAEAVEVVCEGEVVGTFSVRLNRKDVNKYLNAAAPKLTGFDGLLNLALLPPQFELALYAKTPAHGPTQFATIRGSHSRLESSFPSTMHPLAVTSLGRTGSSLLMRMLSVHPEIVVHGTHPFEERWAQYWMQVLTVLSAPANHDYSSHPDHFLRTVTLVGHNPSVLGRPYNGSELRDWAGGKAIEETAAFCQGMVESAYRAVLRDQKRESARLFAEKCVPGHATDLMWQLYSDMRQIVLIRDPRDMMCSMISFDQKRGIRSFQEAHEDALDTFCARLASGFRRLITAWRTSEARSLLLRYEDLVGDPSGTARRIAGHCGLDASPDILERMSRAATLDTPEIQLHRTTADWSQSIGRFREVLSPAIQVQWEELAGDLFRELGYPSQR